MWRRRQEAGKSPPISMDGATTELGGFGKGTRVQRSASGACRAGTVVPEEGATLGRQRGARIRASRNARQRVRIEDSYKRVKGRWNYVLNNKGSRWEIHIFIYEFQSTNSAQDSSHIPHV